MGVKLEKFKAADCVIKEADFSEAKLIKASFSGSDLERTNFHRADLTNVDFSGAKNYRIDVRETAVKGAKFSMPEVLELLHALDIKIEQ